MLANLQEYTAMHAVEESHWWYASLHRKVIEHLLGLNPASIQLLDAGCGTGGFLLKCKKNKITNAQGFDYSSDAVRLSQSRGLEVKKASILKLEELYPSSFFDVVVCNDVFYQFEKDEIIQALIQIQKVLKPGGICISNNQAFEIFRGTHDIAVGSKIRFTLADFKEYLEIVKKLEIDDWHYWSYYLSPFIALVRFVQRIKLRLAWIKPSEVRSDVSDVPKWLNKILYNFVSWEEKLTPNAPFGSSLFLVMKKK